jgi:hypothetical protein
MFRIGFIGALALGAQLALAQVPAAPATAKPKPPQPAMCSACHTLEANQMAGYLDSAAFKSQSIQLDVGAAAPQILRFDAKALKVIDAGNEKPAEHLRDVKKRHETRVTWVEKDGAKFVTEIRFKGPVAIEPKNLIDYAGVAVSSWSTVSYSSVSVQTELEDSAGILLLPGTVYDEPTHVRLGFGRSSLPEVLELFETWIETRS